jgi:hypothetical protein
MAELEITTADLARKAELSPAAITGHRSPDIHPDAMLRRWSWQRRQLRHAAHVDCKDDDFKLSELRAVRSINGETVIGELDQAGTLALREDLYTPGELLRTDQLLPAGTDHTEAQ